MKLVESRENISLPKVHISVIGDLDGSYGDFIERLREQGFMQGNRLEYPSDSRNIVFTGDILADVEDGGFKILQLINTFRSLAQEKGKDISVLAGNHEEFMIGYLIGESANLGIGEIGEFLKLNQQETCNKAKGLTELYQFGKNRNVILQKMRESSYGKIILDEICKLKLIDIAGDTLFFHTPPTRRMLDLLKGKDISKVVNSINDRWQNALKILLLGENATSQFSLNISKILGKETNEELSKKDYLELADIFLRTANDTPDSILMRLGKDSSRLQDYKEYFASTESSDYDFLSNQGITTIVYGHTDSKLPNSKIKFIPVNLTSVEINAPAEIYKDFTPINPKSVEWIQKSQSENLSEIFDEIDIDYILDAFFEDYDNFVNAGYKMGFYISDDVVKKFQEKPHLQELLKKLTRDVLQIKEYNGELRLRLGLEYFESDFGTPKRFEKNLPRNISEFLDKIYSYIISKGIKNT